MADEHVAVFCIDTAATAASSCNILHIGSDKENDRPDEEDNLNYSFQGDEERDKTTKLTSVDEESYSNDAKETTNERVENLKSEDIDSSNIDESDAFLTDDEGKTESDSRNVSQDDKNVFIGLIIRFSENKVM